LKLSKILEIAAVASLILAPFTTFIISESILSRQISPYTNIKELLQIIIIVILSGFLIFKYFYYKFIDLIRIWPFYPKVSHQYFYSVDGTVVSRSSYTLRNGWFKKLDMLPEENLVWHSEINDKSILYRLYYRGSFQDRMLSSSLPTISAANIKKIDHFLSWQPSVVPAVARKEKISFMVEIQTPETENMAFTAGGTKLGFGIHLTTRRVSLTAYAPFGFKFVLIDPFITLRDGKSLGEIRNKSCSLEKPIISPDGSILFLTIKRPLLNKRYWIHYRFESIK